jgi:probable F420-dependent oxidoreductase
VQIGVTLRNMGDESTATTMAECARAVDSLGFDSLWITDHIAIPPDDAVGSGGRYVDPLITLAWMAGFTSRVRLGVGVMVLPYRAPLPFAKQVAALQELSGGRLLLGVGVGWMAAEFAALGVDRRARARLTDETLAFLRGCFESDVVEANGQPFLFKPRPPRPPILVGGAAPHALERAARYGDAWLPMARAPDDVRDAIDRYRALTTSLGRPRGGVTVMTRVDLDDAPRAQAQVDAWRALGVERIVCTLRYGDAAEYRRRLEALAQVTR